MSAPSFVCALARKVGSRARRRRVGPTELDPAVAFLNDPVAHRSAAEERSADGDGALYARKPLRVIDGIPVFSVADDDYTDNYRLIADEHVSALRETGASPFMSQDHIRRIESATAEMLVKHVPAGSRVVDIGVGLGGLLSRAGCYDAYGLDISLDYLRVARRRGIDVCFARIEDMPYRENVFDAAVCTDVLEHVLDLNLCVEKVLAVVRPGGRLVVRSPSREDLSPYLGYKYRFVHLRILDGAMLELFFDRVFGCPAVEVLERDGEVTIVVEKPRR